MILTGQNKKNRTTIILAFNLPVNQTVTPDFLLIKKKSKHNLKKNYIKRKMYRLSLRKKLEKTFFCMQRPECKQQIPLHPTHIHLNKIAKKKKN